MSKLPDFSIAQIQRERSPESIQHTIRCTRSAPILELFRKNCVDCFAMGPKLSADEMDLAFQGQHVNKGRITYESAGDGFLVFSCGDAESGRTFAFSPKMCTKWDRNITGFTVAFSAVLAVLKHLEGRWHHVFVDNLYGNLKLAEERLMRKILWTSTMRVDKMPKSLKLSERGPKREFVSEKVGNVLCVMWRDRKLIKFATTGH